MFDNACTLEINLKIQVLKSLSHKQNSIAEKQQDFKNNALLVIFALKTDWL